jgi:hypothetical protein
LEGGKRLGAGEKPTVDEEAGCSRHAERAGRVQVLRDPGAHTFRRHVALELLEIQAYLFVHNLVEGGTNAVAVRTLKVCDIETPPTILAPGRMKRTGRIGREINPQRWPWPIAATPRRSGKTWAFPLVGGLEQAVDRVLEINQ